MTRWINPLLLAFAGAVFLVALPVAAADDAVRTRVAVMKELSTHTKAISAYLKGDEDPKLGTPGDVEFRAMAIAGLAKRLPTFFPAGTSADDLPGKTRAKPEIWSMSDRFAAAAAKLEAAAGKLEAAAATGDKANIAAAMDGFGKTTCGGCHSTFRGPKPETM